MSNIERYDFDPYYTWLGISLDEQPPTHYRLLGIADCEPSADVIENAADRITAFLRTKATGQHAALSQSILNEVVGASGVLLDEQKKAAYDAELRTAQRPPAELPLPAPPIPATSEQPQVRPAETTLSQPTVPIAPPQLFTATPVESVESAPNKPSPYVKSAPVFAPLPVKKRKRIGKTEAVGCGCFALCFLVMFVVPAFSDQPALGLICMLTAVVVVGFGAFVAIRHAR